MAEDAASGRDDVLDPDDVAALVSGLADPSHEVRIVMFEALTRLPLHPATWAEVTTYAISALGRSESLEERLAVIDATAVVPIPALAETVARLAHGDHGAAAARAVETMVKPAAAPAGPLQPDESPLRPRWAGGVPAGFSVDADLAAAHRALDEESGEEADHPYVRLGPRTRTVARAFSSAAVTVLFERAAERGDFHLSNDVVRWVHEMQRSFRPDLDGLFAVYRREAAAVWTDWRRDGPEGGLFPAFFSPGLEVFHRWICWQIGWTVSRGGLRGLIPPLSPYLRSTDTETRLAAACLIADAADYSPEPLFPLFGGGFGPERRVNASVPLSGAGQAAVAPKAQDDVQFSVYRPRVVRPERWYPLLVFAHRTSTFEDADGRIVDPVKVVEQQAQALLSDQAVPFDPVRTDSPRVERGTELVFVPWLEGGHINPTQAAVRWEEPIHRLEFRLRAPGSADGARLRGGLRVFRSGLLIGEVLFQVSVTATAPVARASERVPVQRYRKIFASYSHKDADVVQLVTDYVEATGDEYLMDVRNLRSGEVWAQRLEELIASADVFQLFWSSNSMASEFVRQEWEYALGLGRPEFIRPVYWEVPIPADQVRGLPPEALRRLQFAQLPLRPSASIEMPEDGGAPPASLDTSEDGRALPSLPRSAPSVERSRGPRPPSPPPRLSRMPVVVVLVLCVVLAVLVAALLL